MKTRVLWIKKFLRTGQTSPSLLVQSGTVMQPLLLYAPLGSHALSGSEAQYIKNSIIFETRKPGPGIAGLCRLL